MENFYITNPIQLRIFDIITNKVKKIYVVIGTVPRAIINDIAAAAQQIQNGTRVHSNIIKSLIDFYGPKYADKLALYATPKNIKVGGGDDAAEFDVIYENEFSGGKDITEEEIAELLNAQNGEKEATGFKMDSRPYGQVTDFNTGEYVEYIYNIGIYPEDRLDDFREKIFAITGIRIFDQHLFYYENGRIRGLYKMFIRGAIDIDITNIATGSQIAGIDIDKQIYDYRDDVKIEAYDAFRIMATTSGPFYIVSLSDVINKRFSQFKSLVGDTYQLDLLYYGFVLKYFPIVSREIFDDLLFSDYGNIASKYPLLDMSRNAITSKYEKQGAIIDDNYKAFSRGVKLSQNVLFSINTAQTIHYSKTIVNLRNLFDLLKTSALIPEIHAYLKNDNIQYFVNKKHNRAGPIRFPPQSVMNDGIILAISLYREDQENFHARTKMGASIDEQSRFFYLNIRANGIYSVRGVFTEEDKIDFDTFETRVRAIVNPIIKQINSYGKYIFSDDELAPIDHFEYKSLNITVFWKRFITSAGYKLLKRALDKYYSSGIIIHRSVKVINAYEFLFHKGMYEFDPDILEKTIIAAGGVFNNTYSHFVDSIASQKWDQQYIGKVVKLYHRNSDVACEIINVRKYEFKIFLAYMHLFFTDLELDKNLRIGNIENISSVRKVKKLREQDPELYNLRKYGSKKNYSIICQNHHQPIIVNDTIESMTKAEREKVVKYWNFTLSKPAYYYCPNIKFPHLSFITGEHPKKYCLPCCKKIESGIESRKATINSECLKTHMFDSTEAATGEHILLYNKNINVGRFSYLPDVVYSILNPDNKFDHDSGFSARYFIYGVEQKLLNIDNVGILNTFTYLLDVKIADMIAKFKNFFKTVAKSREIFINLLGGNILEYFTSYENMIMAMHDLFVTQKMFTINMKTSFQDWKNLFLELIYLVYELNIYIFEDVTNYSDRDFSSGNIQVNLFMPEYITNNIISDHIGGRAQSTRQSIILMVYADYVYPCIRVQKLGKLNYNIKKLFNSKSAETETGLVNVLNDIIISEYFTTKNDSIIDYIFIRKLCEQKSKYEIYRKLINKSNLCYCVILSIIGTKPQKYIHINIDYSSNIIDGVESIYSTVERTEFNCEFHDAIDFINAVNDFIDDFTLKYIPLIVESVISFDGKIIGMMLNEGLLIYISDTNKIPILLNQNKNSTQTKKITQPGAGNLKVPYQISKYVAAETVSRLTEHEQIPIKKISYDYNSINEKILARAPPKPDPTITKLGYAFYNNYLYHLIVIEFMNYLYGQKNIDLRKKITAAVHNAKYDKSEDIKKCKNTIKTLIGDNIIDYTTIINILEDALEESKKQNNIVKYFDDKFAEKKFDFDNVILGALIKMPKDERVREILNIFKNIIVVGPTPDNLSFQNMFVPCSADENLGYCSGKKLIVDEESGKLEEYANLLADDVGDNLTLKFIINYNIDMNFINFLNFRENTSEILEINKLQTIK